MNFMKSQGILEIFIFYCTLKQKEYVQCCCFFFMTFKQNNKTNFARIKSFFAQTWRSWHQLSFLTSPQKLSLRFFSFPTKPTLNCHKNVVWRCAKKTKEPEQHISLCNGSKIIECLKFKHSIILNKPKRYLEYMWISFTG